MIFSWVYHALYRMRLCRGSRVFVPAVGTVGDPRGAFFNQPLRLFSLPTPPLPSFLFFFPESFRLLRLPLLLLLHLLSYDDHASSCKWVSQCRL